MNGSRRPCIRGFSLLELLVALAITTSSLLALYHASGTSVRAAAEAERQTRALVLAESLLALHSHAPIEGIATRGQLDEQLQWSVTASPTTDADASDTALRLHRIEVSVSWQDRGRTRTLSLVSRIPEQAG